MNRRILVNLVFFALVFGLLLSWAAANIISVDQIDKPYPIKAQFTATAGVAANAEVAYLGVHYGRVSSVQREPGVVEMTLKIDDGKQIPKGSIARIFRKSAIGEPYIDFKPPDGYTDGGPYIAEGDVVPVEQTRVPLEFSELLRAANNLLANVNPDKAGDLIHELSVALDGRADALRSITSSLDTLTATFAAKTDVLDRLATNSTAITHVLAQHADDLGQSLTNLRLLADALATSNPDTTNVLDNGTKLVGQLADLVAYGKADLDCTLKDLTNITSLAVDRLPGTDYLLTNGAHAFDLLWSTRDEDPDGLWVRVNLLTDATSTPPRQYDPPLELPAVREVPACASTLPASSGPASTASADFEPAKVLAQSSTRAVTLPATGGTALAGLAGALVLAAFFVRRSVTRAR